VVYPLGIVIAAARASSSSSSCVDASRSVAYP